MTKEERDIIIAKHLRVIAPHFSDRFIGDLVGTSGCTLSSIRRNNDIPSRVRGRTKYKVQPDFFQIHFDRIKELLTKHGNPRADHTLEYKRTSVPPEKNAFEHSQIANNNFLCQWR